MRTYRTRINTVAVIIIWVRARNTFLINKLRFIIGCRRRRHLNRRRRHFRRLYARGHFHLLDHKHTLFQYLDLNIILFMKYLHFFRRHRRPLGLDKLRSLLDLLFNQLNILIHINWYFRGGV